MGHLSALLASPAFGHRCRPRGERRAREPGGRLVRRGHDDVGGGGGAAFVGRGARPGRRAGPVLVDAGPGVSRQDECDDGARGAGTRARVRGVRLRRVVAFCGGDSAAGVGGRGGRAHDAGRRLGPEDRLSPARPKSETAVTPRLRSCARPMGRWPSPSSGGGGGERQNSSTAGAQAGREPTPARVGGAGLRRGDLRAIGARGLRRRVEGRRTGRGRRRPRRGDRPARAGDQGCGRWVGRARRGAGARPRGRSREPGRGPRGGCPVRRAGAGGSGAGDRGVVVGGRRGCLRAADDARAGGGAAGAGRGRRPLGGRAGGGRTRTQTSRTP